MDSVLSGYLLLPMKDAHNPYHLCTWDSPAVCDDCVIAGTLKCRFTISDLAHFLALVVMIVLPSVLGMIRAGYVWYTIGWIGFWIFFFEVWEIRILCSHCPFYAEDSRVLHCIANYGSFKLWPYHPEPITRGEKVQFIIGVIIFAGYPFPFLLAGGQIEYALIAFWAVILFVWTLRKYTCSVCVNFSCIFNSVSPAVRDGYLHKNLVMKQTWKD